MIGCMAWSALPTRLAAVGLLLWAVSARAETLEQAWARAADSDQQLAAAKLDTQSAEAQARAASGARWPSLAAGAAYTRLNASPQFDLATSIGTFRSDPLFKDNQVISGNVQLTLPLYAGGQISAGVEAAQRTAAGSRDSEQAAGADLKLAVAQAYVQVLRTRRALGAADSSVASLTAHVNDVQALLDRELVSRSDLLAARVTLANAEQMRTRAANAVLLALGEYNRLLGEPLDRAPELDEHLPVDPALATLPLAQLVQRAVSARGELKAVSAESQALSARARAEMGKALPQVALSGSYIHFDNDFLDRDNFATVGVGFSWSLFDGGQARNRAAALHSASRAADRRLDDMRSRIELQVRQAWLDVQEAQSRLRTSAEAVAQAEENLRTARELYGASMGTNTQVLDAVALQVTAIDNRDNATLDASLSLLALAHAIGTL
jgi:outer membrane protein TolC